MPTFLLSPANLAGKRAGYLRTGQFELARRFRTQGAPIGELFAFTSGLYFRGKLAYANRFGRGLVITAGRGLVPVETVLVPEHLDAFAEVPIDAGDERYVRPLRHDLLALDGPVVLLGSLATDKYVAPLSAILGDRLLYPPAFVGQGDMRRGSMLLRCVREGVELEYAAWSRRT